MMKSPLTFIDGKPSNRLDLDADARKIPVAGSLIHANRTAKTKELRVTREGATDLKIGMADLELRFAKGQNGKTKVFYYQDPNNESSKLVNMRLVLRPKNGGKLQQIRLAFNRDHKVEEMDPTNPLKKHPASQNSYMTEVEIPQGNYDVEIFAAKLAKPERETNTNPIKDRTHILDFVAEQNRRAAATHLQPWQRRKAG